MSEVNVLFLGQEYSVPKELKEFVGYLHYFEEIHNEIIPLLTSQIKKKEYSGGADKDFIYWKIPLSKTGEKIITKLAEHNIYDVTLDDLVFNNKGYIQLHSVCKDTMQGMVNILLNAMQSWEQGYNSAYSSAASTITGSGVSIWTNRLSSVLIYSALEASTLKKQADKADAQYRNAMSSLNTRVTNQQEKAENELLVNKYYPGVAEALGLFVSEMMEYYVNKLEQKGLFEYSKVKKYNLPRSSELVKNMSLVTDKEGLLREAFICCPYNPDVYNSVLENNLADLPTFETAMYFMQDKILTNSLEKYVQANSEKIDLISIPVSVLALYKKKKESDIWKWLYHNEYLKLHRHYEKLNNVIKDRKALVQWIKENITDDAAFLCSMRESDLNNKVQNIINQKIITDEQFSLFDKLEMLNNEFIVTVSTLSLDNINKAYAELITQTINQFLPEVISYNKKYTADAELSKEKYIEAKKNNDIQIAELNKQITDLQNQKSKLGIFAFSKKKEIGIKITEIEAKIGELKNSAEIRRLKTEYEFLDKMAHSIDYE